MLRQSNQILHEMLGSEDGVHPRVQWRAAQSLVSLIPQFDLDGHPVYDMICECGKNVRVHAPTCQTLSYTKVRMVKVLADLRLEDEPYRTAWILARWIAPPPVSQWRSMFGTDEDYPSEGRYLPFMNSAGIVYLPRERPPLPGAQPGIARFVMQNDIWLKEELQQSREKMREREVPLRDEHGKVLEAPPRYYEILDELNNATPLAGHAPGEKDHVSFPSVSSPNPSSVP